MTIKNGRLVEASIHLHIGWIVLSLPFFGRYGYDVTRKHKQKGHR